MGGDANGTMGWTRYNIFLFNINLFVYLALLAFSDGRYIGAILDRNGLRPARYCVTADDHIYLASEVGVNDLPVENVIKRVGLKITFIQFIKSKSSKINFGYIE